MSGSEELQVSPQEVQRLLNEGEDFVLLDCREPFEVQIAHIQGDLHIPMRAIPARMPELDRHQRVIVYCHHGVRSLQVAQFLRRNGYDHAQSMSGGIDQWSKQIDPEVPRY